MADLLPPDPARLREIEDWLKTATGTSPAVITYLQLQRNAVKERLDAFRKVEYQVEEIRAAGILKSRIVHTDRCPHTEGKWIPGSYAWKFLGEDDTTACGRCDPRKALLQQAEATDPDGDY